MEQLDILKFFITLPLNAAEKRQLLSLCRSQREKEREGETERQKETERERERERGREKVVFSLFRVGCVQRIGVTVMLIKLSRSFALGLFRARRDTSLPRKFIDTRSIALDRDLGLRYSIL